MEKKYTITCTEEELNTIRMCVEVCHRISCGQLDSLNEIVPRRIDDNLLRQVKETAFPELKHGQEYCWNGGYGKLHEPNNKKLAEAFNHFQCITYPIYREIYHFFAVQKQLDNVYQSETLNAGHGGFIVINKIHQVDGNEPSQQVQKIK